MASYGELLHSISTAAINQILREYNFTQWAFFVNEDEGLSGVAFANDQNFGMYTATDTDKLTLGAFGIVPISDLYFQPGGQTLNLQHKGEEAWHSVLLFTDASRLGDDEQLLPNFDYSLTATWRQYLRQRGMRLPPPKRPVALKKIAVGFGVLLLLAIVFLLVYRPQ